MQTKINLSWYFAIYAILLLLSLSLNSLLLKIFNIENRLIISLINGIVFLVPIFLIYSKKYLKYYVFPHKENIIPIFILKILIYPIIAFFTGAAFMAPSLAFFDLVGLSFLSSLFVPPSIGIFCITFMYYYMLFPMPIRDKNKDLLTPMMSLFGWQLRKNDS